MFSIFMMRYIFRRQICRLLGRPSGEAEKTFKPPTSDVCCASHQTCFTLSCSCLRFAHRVCSPLGLYIYHFFI